MNYRGKTSGAKKKGLVLSLFLSLLQKVLAWIIWLVVALLVIIVAAVVIISLIQLIKRKFPDPPPADGDYKDPANVTRIMLRDENGNDIFWVYDDAPTNPAGISVASLEGLGITSFDLQYRIASVGSNGPVASLYCGSSAPGILIGDTRGVPDNYTFNLWANGKAFQITCLYGIYSTEVLSNDTNMYQVVIERSTNMVDWHPIFTNNACELYTIQNYTDSSLVSPQAFYRLHLP